MSDRPSRELEQIDENTAGIRVTIRSQEPDGSPASFETRDRAVLKELAELLELRPEGYFLRRVEIESDTLKQGRPKGARYYLRVLFRRDPRAT